jgi:hypothetical protein
MKDFMLLMHSDTTSTPNSAQWARHFEELRAKGRFQGGSAIGAGVCLRKEAVAGPVHGVLSGYIRVLAADLDDAKQLVFGNPVFEAGGTVEVRELPRE